jgi:hypothetical protein
MTVTETTPLRFIRTPDFMPANCGRTFYSGLTTILADIWLSLAAIFYRNIPIEKAKISVLSSTTSAAIERLSNHQRLSNYNLSEVKKIVEKKHPEFKVYLEYVAPTSATSLDAIRMEEDTKIAIPFVLTGFDDHIVTALYDNKTKTLEFFNSSGLTVNDTPDRLVLMQGLGLRAFMDQLKDRFHPERVIENTTKAQYDTYNCGLYVSDFILRRADGEDFQHISDHPLSAFETTTKRTEMIGLILANAEPTESISASKVSIASDEFEMI